MSGRVLAKPDLLGGVVIGTSIYALLAWARFSVGPDSGSLGPFTLQFLVFGVYFVALPRAMLKGGLGWEGNRGLYLAGGVFGLAAVFVASVMMPDAAIGYILFMAITVGHVAAIRLVVSTRTALSALACSLIVLASGCTILLVSWLVLFFE